MVTTSLQVEMDDVVKLVNSNKNSMNFSLGRQLSNIMDGR